MSKLQIQVCYSPALFPAYSDRESIVVVTDVLRATSAMCAAFESGIESIMPVSTVAEALEFKDEENYLLAAERNGRIVKGFDLGNSPIDILKHDLKGKHLVMTTTNGTKTINVAKRDHQVVVGSFINVQAVCDWLVAQNKNIIIVCSGWKDTFCLEDTLFAGSLTMKLEKTGAFEANCDAAIGAGILYDKAKDDLFGFLECSSHRKRLADLDIYKDVEYCMQKNTSKKVPILKGDVLYCD
ncbi:MAG: 2-phosphosulfolactate phosphatase [Flavobacteriales bacterium]|jgi:2-phosphosulfolactate phosphatase